MNAIRAFIAVELPEAIRQQLSEIEQQIQFRAGETAHRAVRWVSPSNMHLTLKFLGEVSTGSVQALADILQRVTTRRAAFEVTVEGLGAFPNIRRPRVIWVGTDHQGELTALQRAIEAETSALGYPAEERPFSPHLTLGRVSQNARPEEVTQVARALAETRVGSLGTVRIDYVHLFKSDLRPTGPIYTSLFQFALQGKTASPNAHPAA